MNQPPNVELEAFAESFAETISLAGYLEGVEVPPDGTTYDPETRCLRDREGNVTAKWLSNGATVCFTPHANDHKTTSIMTLEEFTERCLCEMGNAEAMARKVVSVKMHPSTLVAITTQIIQSLPLIPSNLIGSNLSKWMGIELVDDIDLPPDVFVWVVK